MAVEVVLGVPQPKQELFLTSTERFVAYGGARGGGKSWALRFKLKALCLVNPGIKCLIVRRTYAELFKNHIEVLLGELPESVAVYRDKNKSFCFCNGSVLQLGYCDSERDVLQYQGQEYDVIAIDEATQLTEYQFQCLKACLRGTNSFPKRMYLTCNPGGVGHAWVKRLFIDREYRVGEKAGDYKFIGASVYDNEALMANDPEYVCGLESLPEDMRRAWLNGEWDVFEGQFFREFNREIHVCEPFSIPDEWYKYRSFDYGLDMLACLWTAVDGDGNAYVYREVCESDLIVSEAAERILSMTPNCEKIRETYAPPDLWSRQKDSGKSMFEIFCENGLDIIKASNDRVQGWAQVKERMRMREVADPISGEKSEKPGLYIFSTCRELIRNIPLLQYDRHNPNDASTEPHAVTHNTDALRYFCVSRASVTPGMSDEATGQKKKRFARRFFKRRRRIW